jgi:hypothetical protein
MALCLLEVRTGVVKETVLVVVEVAVPFGSFQQAFLERVELIRAGAVRLEEGEAETKCGLMLTKIVF